MTKLILSLLALVTVLHFTDRVSYGVMVSQRGEGR